jgi:hypothetical protein
LNYLQGVPIHMDLGRIPPTAWAHYDVHAA